MTFVVEFWAMPTITRPSAETASAKTSCQPARLTPALAAAALRFSSPLLAPSVVPGIELEPLGELAGLPAFAAPQGEPWVYDGRIILRRA